MNYFEYEQRKRQLQTAVLSPKEYEAEIQKIIKELENDSAE